MCVRARARARTALAEPEQHTHPRARACAANLRIALARHSAAWKSWNRARHTRTLAVRTHTHTHARRFFGGRRGLVEKFLDESFCFLCFARTRGGRGRPVETGCLTDTGSVAHRRLWEAAFLFVCPLSDVWRERLADSSNRCRAVEGADETCPT